jgi:hypothetical protein
MNCRSLLPVFVIVSTLSGCDDLPGDNKDPLGDGEAADNGGCVDTVTVLGSVDEVAALGFSAAQVLAVAEGSHASELVWGAGLGEGPVTVAFGPESGAGTLTVDVAYAGGEVRFVSSKPEESEGEGLDDGAFLASCSDRLEVDVEVSVKTGGGALDESFTAPLRATSRGISRISREIAVEELAGSFALTTVEPDDAEVGPLEFTIGISGSGLFGGISSTVQLTDGEVASAGFMDVASWPGGASPCEFEEAPVGLDDAVAQFSGADALALIAAAQDVQLSWGGEPTAMTLAVTPGAVACAYDSGDWAGQLRIPAEIAVQTADGRWDGSFAVDVLATPAADGSLSSVIVQITAAYASTVAIDEFAAKFGIADVDLSGFDEGGLTFSSEYTPADGGPAVTGALTVLGVKLPMCSSEPGAGCEGNDYTELDMATWSN